MPICEKCKKDKFPNDIGEYRGAKLCRTCELEAIKVVNKAFDDWLLISPYVDVSTVVGK